MTLRAQHGMSLVEATVVLAVASLLAAVVAPSIRAYVQTAQQAAAKKDVEAIGTAITRMLTDVGESFILKNAIEGTGSTATAHVTPSHDTTTNRVDMLVSDGKTPTVYSGVVRGSGTDWNAAAGTNGTQKLEYYLVLNIPSNTSANAYRTAATMDATENFDPDGAQTFNSEHAWRGAYLPGPIGPDPWGYRYAVNVEFLAHPLGTNQGNVNDVIVLSAGNNGLVETAFAIDGVTSTNDVFAVLSGGTR